MVILLFHRNFRNSFIFPADMILSRNILLKPTFIHVSLRFTGHQIFQHVKNAIQNPAVRSLIPLRDLHFWDTLRKKAHQDFLLQSTKPVFYAHKNGICTSKIHIKVLPNHVKDSIPSKFQADFHYINDSFLYPNTKHVSGIFQASPTFYIDNPVSNKMHTILMLVKFTYCVYGGEPITCLEDFAKRIILFFEKDELLDDPSYYPKAQHLVTNYCLHIRLPRDVMIKLTYNQIDFSSYKDEELTVNLLLETNVLKIALNTMLKTKGEELKIVAQNPDEVNGDHLKYASSCYDQMGQPHGDFRIVDSKTGKMWFYDVKLVNDTYNRLPLTKGLLSLATSNQMDKQMLYMKRFRGDIKGKEPTINLSDTNTKNALSKMHMKTNDIINNKDPIEKKRSMFETEQNYFDLNPKVKNVICSRIGITQSNTFFDQFMQNQYGNILPDLILISSQIPSEDLFPKNSQMANVSLWHVTTLKIIAIMPQEMREDLINNYQVVKMIEYKYNHE